MAADSEDVLSDTSDEIWRPGYTGPPPRTFPIESRFPNSQEPAAPAASRPRVSRARRSATVVGGVAAAAAVAVVATVAVVRTEADDRTRSDVRSERSPADTFQLSNGLAGSPSVSGDRPPLPDPVAESGVPFAGADPRRLPATIAPIWSRSVEAGDNDDIWVQAVGRRYVVVAVGGDVTAVTGSTVLTLIEPESGDTRWSSELAVPLRSVGLVTANDGVLVVVLDGTLTGIDASTGAVAWTFSGSTDLTKDGVEHLVGTGLLAIGSTDGTSSELVDVASGKTVGRFDGPRIGTDRLGRWYVRRGDAVLEYDLGDGFQDPIPVARGVDDPVVAVVGREVISSGPQGWTTWPASDVGAGDVAGTDGRVRAGAEAQPIRGAERFPSTAAILPMPGSTFIVTGEGSILGAELDGDTMRAGWVRSGIATSLYATERGYLVHVAGQGGAVQTILDGRTGETVVTLTMTPGLFDSLVVTGNGILTRKTRSVGSRLAALDLDGDEMWSLTDVDTASVGDRLIVTTSRMADRSIRIDAAGEPS